MPELPEVECLTRALRPILEHATISKANFYRKDLRGPIPIKLFNKLLVNQPIERVTRRSKYMLWESKAGIGIIHLGMTGNVIFRDHPEPSIPHTHAVFELSRDNIALGFLHYIDARRFGWITCCTYEERESHPFFAKLGPEPLMTPNLVEHLWEKSRKKTVSIKVFLMNANIVVGVGNIYASEALFRAGIRPTRPAGKVTRSEMNLLAEKVKETLSEAIEQGGTSFKDFKNADGKPGYFAISLNVYGRLGELCKQCDEPITLIRQGGRATYYCSHCQK